MATACICGDVIYDIQHQIVEPFHQVLGPETPVDHRTASETREVVYA